MTDDLISRSELYKDLYCGYSLDFSELPETKTALLEMIANFPSAEPQRKKGKWKVCDILDYAQRPTGRKILRCPFCGYLTDEFRGRVDYYLRLTHYCSNCGAEMKKGETDDN